MKQPTQSERRTSARESRPVEFFEAKPARASESTGTVAAELAKRRAATASATHGDSDVFTIDSPPSAASDPPPPNVVVKWEHLPLEEVPKPGPATTAAAAAAATSATATTTTATAAAVPSYDEADEEVVIICGIDGCTLRWRHLGICQAPILQGARARREPERLDPEEMAKAPQLLSKKHAKTRALAGPEELPPKRSCSMASGAFQPAAPTAAAGLSPVSDEDVPLTQRSLSLMLPPPAPAPLDEVVCSTASDDLEFVDVRDGRLAPPDVPALIGQCEKNPDCIRGYQHRGFGGKGGGSCSLRKPSQPPGRPRKDHYWCTVTLQWVPNGEQPSPIDPNEPVRDKWGRKPAMTAEEALQQAEAEGLTLLRSEKRNTGYFGVTYQPQHCKSRPYQAEVMGGSCGDRKKVSVGSFATVEEAALNVARTPEAQAAVAAAAAKAAAPPPTAEEVVRQADAEGLTLVRADGNASGYMFVIYYKDRERKPYQAKTCRGKKRISMGYYDTAEEAALVVARTPEGKAAAAAGVSMTAEEAIAQAEAEGLTLMRSVASNSGFWNVRFSEPTAEEPRPYHRLGHFGGKPYKAKVALGGKLIELGSFVTVEEGTPRRGSNPGLAESPNLRLTHLSPPPHRRNSGARRGAQG